MQLSSKQNEYIVNATHRWNIKSGAVRSGKSYVDTAFVVPFPYPRSGPESLG